MHFLLFFFTVFTFLSLSEVLGQRNIIQCMDNQDCVSAYLCANGTINTDGGGFISGRLSSECDTGNFSMCCLKPEKKTKPSIIKLMDKVTNDTNVHKCGYLKKKLENRILGGEEAEVGQFPWLVALLNKTTIFGQVANIYFCGGTLIHPRVVLTVAHCVQNRNHTQILVRAGELDLKKVDGNSPHQDGKVSKVVIHEKFNEGNLRNDIALLFLKDDFLIEGINNNVGWICIPKLDQSFVKKTCTVSGFGKTEEGGKYPSNLTAAQVEIREQDDCSQRLRKTILGDYFDLNERFICAGGEKGVDACQGDGGSPLSCEIAENRYCLSGLVSWGIDCGKENVPGVYTNVAYFREWIDKIMFDENLVPLHSED